MIDDFYYLTNQENADAQSIVEVEFFLIMVNNTLLCIGEEKNF